MTIGADRGFPVLHDHRDPYAPRAMPRALAELAYEAYRRRYGTSQSLDRIGERGGFGLDEIHKLTRPP